MTRAINTVLIANRGEIACRIIRTCKRMGIRSIAVYSEADRDALHVALADEAYEIGAAPPRESYLNQGAIIRAAEQSGADAVHPGYGFLSENAVFAEACAKAGLIFIGPPPAAIRAMGSKSEAKALMEKAGVPLVPGYHGTDQSPKVLQAAADQIGYPVLIKASAGGGGKGMKVASSAGEFQAALESAQREAKNAFGDDRVLVEKYLQQPRHIEAQIFGDCLGNIVHLFERDCSIQRRHQKVIEEAPAPGLSPERRAAIGKAAIEAGKAVGYVGAGTVEFIAEGESFYFMEMNTRLQVEHPVTEAITGLDLVEWQIRIARGEKLPKAQSELAIHGHAMEVRLYAEDPARDFLPQTGTLHHLRFPEGARVDSGIREGDAVSIHYDPMIAKIITHGADRAEAIARLRRALAATEVGGLATNLDFLQAILRQPDFASGKVDTGFIERHRTELLPEGQPLPVNALALAALAVLRGGERDAAAAAPAGDPYSPWSLLPGWRVNRDAYSDLIFQHGEATLSVRAHYRATGYALDLPDGTVEAQAELGTDGAIAARIGTARCKGRVVRRDTECLVFLDGATHRLTLVDPRRPSAADAATTGRILAPMPGTVTKILVVAGAVVAKGSVLAIVEAMKMEHAVKAPRDGKVTIVHFAAGDQVTDGAELLVLEEA
ncbi:acetyl/propionyl/methylcrotonyl-CoA carboxylase subunit alpha [Dongia sedimenti]|uniref:Acetyl/propionyl/methylcrotonyl-CoA carboxylase subunit alpha n=1 Tax=Dongia sedimenti TaxID=3064282 RepID=A0ABU0YLP5_9PROT|nr:acetyl/propionyl/methylcrotonyl-CoA carboxylase subunit alpha [Rhodospirillaceae bacterium R-7]